MPRLLLKFVFLIILLLTFTTFAVRAVGKTQPANTALQGFTEGCAGTPQPCWYGIVPGVTTVAESHEVFAHYPYAQACVHLQDTATIITQLELWPCALLPPVHLGDAINQLGGDKMDIICFTDLVNSHNIRMIKR